MSQVETYRQLIERVASTVEYKVDVAALRFVEEVVRCMRERGVNQAELARQLGHSEAYVSKVLRGDTNFTLATMVKIAEVLGEELHLHLAAPGTTVRWVDVIDGALPKVQWSRYKPEHTYGSLFGGGEGDDSTSIAA